MSNPQRPGFKTSEFWLTGLSTIIGLLIASDFFGAESIWARGLGLAAAALASAGYAVSRGMAKRGGE